MKNFTAYLQSKDLSPVTIGLYIRQIHYFIAWYGSEDIINVQKKDVLNYLNYLKQKNLQANTRNQHLISLRHYFDNLVQQEAIKINPTSLIKLRGVQNRKLQYVYSSDELTQLADNFYLLYVKQTQEKVIIKGAGSYMFKRTHLAKIRNYVMLQMFIHQGLHTKEVLQLQLQNIDLQKATVTIQTTTKGKDRTIPLHVTQIGSLMQYLNEVRPNLETKNTDDTLFLPIPKDDPKAKKKPEATFKRMVEQLKKTDRNFINLVQIRTSVITYWVKNYGLRKAQYFAGHKSITSTEQYQANNIEDLAEDITKFNPF